MVINMTTNYLLNIFQNSWIDKVEKQNKNTSESRPIGLLVGVYIFDVSYIVSLLHIWALSTSSDAMIWWWGQDGIAVH